MNEATSSGTVPTGGRRRNPRGQGDQLRREILAAVGRLLDEKLDEGALSVSLREVARETGIAAQSMYLHFADKDQLAHAVAEDGYQRVVAAMRAADARAATDEADAGTRLRAQSDAFCAFARTNRGVFRLMFGHDTSRLGFADQAHPAHVLWQQWLDAVRSCEDEGLHWPDGPEHVAMYLWSALFGRFALWASTFGQDDPETLYTFAHRTIDALLRDATRHG